MLLTKSRSCDETHPLYQLSTEVLRAAKDYAESHLARGKIRPSRSPCEDPLFFVKEKYERLRVVMYYRAMNYIKMKKISPIPRS